MKILNLSDTTLSGSPIRATDIINKYTPHEARHITWYAAPPSQPWRVFKLDLVGAEMAKDEAARWLAWADVVIYHNRWARQEIFQRFGLAPPKKPSAIVIHSPRESEDFSAEVASGLPVAVFAQYHPRLWPEARYLLPNAIDILAPENVRQPAEMRSHPVVSFAPSNWNAKDWDSKGYDIVAPVMKRMALDRLIHSQIITSQPHGKVLEMKRGADIGIDEIATGSYHLSGLEYLSLGIPCFANVDEQTFRAMKQLTGCDSVPFLKANRLDFRERLERIVKDRTWQELGLLSRNWMDRYWSPAQLAKSYTDMYEDLR